MLRGKHSSGSSDGRNSLLCEDERSQARDWSDGQRLALAAALRAIILQAMANLLVRDLPDDVHRALHRRAKSHGQSLQQYLASELTRIAKRPSLAEVLDRIDRRSGGEVGLARAAKDLAEERGQR